jgi:hypothetical protein
MPLSDVPAGGPTIPVGATQVSIKNIDASANAAKEDVTDLSSTEREYAAPVLVDGGGLTATVTCSASGIIKAGTVLAVSATTVTTGWVCEDVEETYEVGKYATWSANWSFYTAGTP